MINAISAADIAFIMSSPMSAWLLSPLECSPQKQNGWTPCFCFWGWIMWKCIIKQLLNSVFAWYHELPKPCVCVICLSLRLRQITQTSVLIIHDIVSTSSSDCLMLWTVPTKYQGFYATLGPRRKSRYLKGLLESAKKNWGSHAFFEIISLESQQKCWHQHFSEKSKKGSFVTDFRKIRF